MPSYVITGAARGLGYEFVQQLSREPTNTVYGLVRNVEKATALNDLSSSRKNIHVIHCDVTVPADIEAAAAKVGSISGGSLDVLIHNAFVIDSETTPLVPTQYTAANAAALKKGVDAAMGTALYAVLWVTNAFLPFIRKGKDKKIIHLSSGMADADFIGKTGLINTVPYALSKASTNILVAKFAAELKDEGISVLAISPGWVATQDPNAPGMYCPVSNPSTFNISFLLEGFRGALLADLN